MKTRSETSAPQFPAAPPAGPNAVPAPAPAGYPDRGSVAARYACITAIRERPDASLPGAETDLCCTAFMAMTCPDCQKSLDDVPAGDPCPRCGGNRRSAVADAEVAMVAASAQAPTISIGYSLEPGWAYQWRSIQQHLPRLREQYQGINTLGNADVEETVHACSSASSIFMTGYTKIVPFRYPSPP